MIGGELCSLVLEAAKQALEAKGYIVGYSTTPDPDRIDRSDFKLWATAPLSSCDIDGLLFPQTMLSYYNISMKSWIGGLKRAVDVVMEAVSPIDSSKPSLSQTQKGEFVLIRTVSYAYPRGESGSDDQPSSKEYVVGVDLAKPSFNNITVFEVLKNKTNPEYAAMREYVEKLLQNGLEPGIPAQPVNSGPDQKVADYGRRLKLDGE